MVLCRLRRGAGDVRRGALRGGSTGGCRRGSESSRGGPAVRHRPSHGEEDAELLGAAGLPPAPRSPTGAKQTRTIVKARHCKKSSAQVRSRLTADPFDLRNTGRKPRVHILSLIDFFELNQ